jgi:hypothetical protein
VLGFNGTVTAGSGAPTRDNQFAQFLLGLATDAQISTAPRATRLNNFWQAYYFQDDWKVTPNFTLNFGVRYEYFQPPTQRGKESNFDLNGFVPVRQTFSGFPDIADTSDAQGAGLPGPQRLGPRIGFAWSMPGMKDLGSAAATASISHPRSPFVDTLTANPPIVTRFVYWQREHPDPRRPGFCRVGPAGSDFRW